MKRLALLVCLPALLGAAGLSGVRSVYLMPMARGLDQYLANRLTQEHVFQVVTDPKLADAVFTDRLGEGFQSQLESFFPSPKPPEPPPPPADTAKDVKEKDKDEIPTGPSLLTESVNKLSNPALNSSFGRGKGTIFLVDAKSRQVVWSTFESVSDSGAKEMNRSSTEIVSRLMKDMGVTKKK